MVSATDIKKYLIDGDNAYFKQDNRKGEILMLSGVWGSGKTHFWKNDLEDELIKNLDQEKSYVYISLYGKDSIEELQNEIQQSSYHFSKEDKKDVISSTYNVFTKVASFIPKISFNAFGIGVEVETERTVEKLEEENIRQQIEKGVGRLKDGGIICFDDFERKSSKIDLNDLFGFITNLTEVFQTKTVIITNQEFFKENDSEVFSRIKEKSVNKFLLFDPTVDELFDTIYAEKYTELDEYQGTILEAIKITEEKNARIFIQVLDNCLEYKDQAKDKNEIFLLVVITVLFVKYNLLFWMEKIDLLVGFTKVDKYIPSVGKNIPDDILNRIIFLEQNYNKKTEFINTIIDNVGNNDKLTSELVKQKINYIENNDNMLFQIYKYIIKEKFFKEEDEKLIKKLNNFVESGILRNE
jgi:hypothetical protein